MGERRGAYRIFVGRTEGMRSLGRPRHRCENNIKMYLQEMGWVWAELIWLRIGRGGSCKCGNEHLVSIYCGKYFLTN
jgi:hypothetical protein